MSALAAFSSLVATLYEAAADPQQWARFLDEFYVAMDGARGCMTAIAAEPERTIQVLQGYSDSEVRAYSDHFYQHDIVLDAGLETMRQQSQWVGPVGEILPYRELERSEIYNDYYRSLDMHHAACLMIGATGPYSALGLAAWRSKRSGPFLPEQLQLVELLAPHLQQAFRLHAQLSTLRVEAHAFHLALGAAEIAVIALRSDGQILAASGPAEAILNRSEVLTRRGGKLHAVVHEKDRSLQQLIDCATRTGALDLGEPGGRTTQPGGCLHLPQADKPFGWQVQVLPARPEGPMTGVSLAALAFVANPGAVPPSRAHILQELYQLTPLEARLADFVLKGIELKQAAQELKLTYESTRFHLKRIFRKTNTTRQAELLRLMLAIACLGKDAIE